MEVMSIRDCFSCVVLDPSNEKELEIYFQGRKVLYEDVKNEDDNDYHQNILKAHKKAGADYYSLNFEDISQAHFILYDNDVIIGSAELTCRKEAAVFSSGHISSAFWGNHLADLLYEAREKYVSIHTEYNKISLSIEHDNVASQKAASRNGFISVENTQNNLLVYEKQIYS